jgi:hypothetical protein
VQSIRNGVEMSVTAVRIRAVPQDLARMGLMAWVDDGGPVTVLGFRTVVMEHAQTGDGPMWVTIVQPRGQPMVSDHALELAKHWALMWLAALG